MKIVINPKNLVVDNTFQVLCKARAVIGNNEGKFAISMEGGKCIFPGGKCERNETEEVAIERELFEELGIRFDNSLEKKLVIESVYDDFYDFRTNEYRPRCTVTTYFYGKTDENVNVSMMNLTDNEVNQGFEVFFASRNDLIKMVETDHSVAYNGKYFDIENKVGLENIISNLKS